MRETEYSGITGKSEVNKKKWTIPYLSPKLVQKKMLDFCNFFIKSWEDYATLILFYILIGWKVNNRNKIAD